jgi:predicted transcriptional regulator with HTH domain
MRLSALDTSFEAELRALIFLFLLDEPTDVDYLACLDTLTVNAHTFGLGETNVNGTHRLASGELNARTHLMLQALQRMTIQGLVHFTRRGGLECFRISDKGTTLVNRLSTQYATDFFNAALETIELVGDKDTNALTSIILTAATPGESR